MLRSHWMSRWLHRAADGLHSAAGMLAPVRGRCPFCGKDMRPAKLSPQCPNGLPKAFAQMLCGSCMSVIPWLNVPKCLVCGRGIVCGDCPRRTNACFIANRSAVQYSSEMREWLAQYKYRGNEGVEQPLAQMMIPAYVAITKLAASRTAAPNYNWDAITFVPVSPERAEERGFNQAERLAAFLSEYYRIPLIGFLVRDRHTEKQSFKSRLERIRDTRRLFQPIPEAFALAGGIPPTRPFRLLLVDDIYTTGSTVQACAETLTANFPMPLDLYSLTWARS
ncbi:ComF family protein [Paenibacillus sp. NEAU-GSW1]|uniref:ComF family protein n=1 Tax=Paenibacillus sp. NEAU-GSW1 TaxID=2682486 RepID=UPI0012E209E8|nr:ComF family protein [Paenibacillus sp. NEAU-GSW1]MUT65023.1 ComF family protein [Paenibacillus sp. NEAU-GSW1]